jgi:uncharacterized membrane protein YkvA (DUF1232 family)
MMDESSPLSSLTETAGFLGGLVAQGRLVWRLLNDKRVSEWVKLIPLAGVIYFLSPIDLIPDLMFPGLGELDDLAVILLSLRLFVNTCPPGIVREHLENLIGQQSGQQGDDERPSSTYIDASYRVLDEDEE